MSKNSVKTILIALYLSAVQDPEPLCLHRQAIITSPPKSAVCSKLSPITLAHPSLLLSCGTSHKVSSQSGSSYFTDSTAQKYSRNQNVETLYLWDVDGVRLETSVCLRVTVAEPNFPDNQNCPSRPCPQAESLWDITSLMQSTQDQRAPHNDPNPSPSFRNSTKKDSHVVFHRLIIREGFK